jgi:hypothetical protein
MSVKVTGFRLQKLHGEWVWVKLCEPAECHNPIRFREGPVIRATDQNSTELQDLLALREAVSASKSREEIQQENAERVEIRDTLHGKREAVRRAKRGHKF